MQRSLGLFLALCAIPSAAFAARLQPASVTASSAYPDENGVSYGAEKLSDGKQSSSWVEGEAGSGLGGWVEIDLGAEKSVQKVRIWGGLWDSADYWKRANRPKEIELSFSDGSKQTVVMKDEMHSQEFPLKPVKTKTVKMKIRAIYDGTTWLDTAISEVQLFDNEPDPMVTPTAITASSVLPADGDGNYDAANAFDRVNDSMWCEGNKAGDGAGEWLKFDFASASKVSQLTMINGVGTSMPIWMKANRAGSATLAFSDGATETVTLKNSMLAQTVAFPAHTTTSVKVTFGGIVKGKEFNDLCVSEASFAP
jgi:hypothetical protein